LLVQELIRFWFDVDSSEKSSPPREFWFRSTPEIDADIAARFQTSHELAALGGSDALIESADGALALILLLDQIPRNIFRSTARAFLTDAKALSIAKHAIDHGFDRAMSNNAKMFLYLPFEHSENLQDQERSIELFTGLGNTDTLKWAVDHCAVIRQFGRFPHRNAIMGRDSTTDELEYLKDHPSWGQG
jgi:uncharacterized protein (DUF924 family)